MLKNCGDDCLNDVAVCTTAAANVDMGLRIAVTPLVRQTAQYLCPIALLEQRSIVPPGSALCKDVDRGIKPDRDRPLVEQLPGARIHERASAGGDNPHFAVDQSSNQSTLSVAEILFAKAFEKVRSAGSGSFLDFDVAVDKRQAKPLCEAPADRRLARAHEANEDDWSIKLVDELLHGSGAIHSASRSGKSLSPSSKQSGANMPRGLIFLVAVIILLVGGIFLLSNSADEVPVKTIETGVTSDGAAN
jgi:hypothetical protein